MISLGQTRSPIRQSRISLGNFSSFINPFSITGDTIPTTPPGSTPSDGKDLVKPVAVLTALALTGLSAATAYVGISYGLDSKKKTFQRAVGWTVGVVGAMSSLVRLMGTVALILIPSKFDI